MSNGDSFRVVDSVMTPFICSPAIYNSNGTLNDSILNSINNVLSITIDNMVLAGEISNFRIVIDPTQKVLTTKKLSIVISIIPVDSLDYIDINIDFNKVGF